MMTFHRCEMTPQNSFDLFAIVYQVVRLSIFFMCLLAIFVLFGKSLSLKMSKISYLIFISNLKIGINILSMLMSSFEDQEI